VQLCLDGEDNPACAPVLELLVTIQVRREDLPAAKETLDRLASLAVNSLDKRTDAFSQLATGRVRAADGDDGAVTDLQSALRSFAALDLPLEAAKAQLELARALAATGPDAAAAEARRALDTFERLGAAPDADAAAALLRSLGAPARAWPKHYGTLTKRETEVLALLAAGCSNAEIGERLYISRRTAEHHVANILSKLGMRSRTEAAAYAARELPERPVAE
jgi:DNA-binding NarL/FixJ family response regulator